MSSADTYILHHVVGFTLPFAQPPMQTQLQTSPTVYNITAMFEIATTILSFPLLTLW